MFDRVLNVRLEYTHFVYIVLDQFVTVVWLETHFFLLSFNFKCLLNFNTNKSIVLSSGKKGVAIVTSAPTVS